MDILVITDIPRMTSLFERLGEQRPGLTVVSDIHRGIEDLDRRRPGLVIFQNRLSGLSADILLKHLKSRLGNRKTRFVLISGSEELEVELSKRFDAILDPALNDQELSELVLRLLDPAWQPRPAVSSELPVTPAPAAVMSGDEERDKTGVELQPSADTAAVEPHDREPADREEVPVTYGAPPRSVVSEFSRQLEHQARGGQTDPVPHTPREYEYRIRDLHQDPHLINDEESVRRPWYRTGWLLLSAATLVLVVVISLLQHRRAAAPEGKHTASVPAPSPDAAKVQMPPAATAGKPAAAVQLPSHGGGRPKKLPSFVPRDGYDQSYGHQHPGWELYQGVASEHRVFREKDGTIKALQVLDRSGAGLQEAFYASMLKELAGTSTMRPASSEVKEGYEIRRGEAGGLQVVQYRDAQGGRLRGIVVTWP